MTKRNGPPPLPTNVKRFRGNPGKRPLPEREPSPTVGTTAPLWLSPYARTEWRRVYKECQRLNLISRLDRVALAAYCEAVADFRLATERAAATQPLVKLTTGNVAENPLHRMKRQARDSVLKAAAELGFTPSARTRVHSLETGETEEERKAREVFGF